MPSHTETRVVPYSPEQMFDLVADIRRYPEFLPWCLKARVREEAGDVLRAEVVIGYKMIRESWFSRVYLYRPSKIDVTYLEGPFRHLTNQWQFSAAEGRPGHTRIDFYIDFEFRTRFLDRMVGPLFNEATRRMVNAFEQRAKAIYG